MGVSILAEMSLLAVLSGVHVRPIVPKAERQIGLGTQSNEAVLPAVRAFISLARTWTESNGYLPV
jgi:DNA-binding transcriptional LysR family regulator